MTQTQTDNQIEEEHLLDFVVNSLSEELSIDLADGAKISTEKLYEVLAGATTSGPLSITSARRLKTLHTLIPSVDTSPISLISILSNSIDL